MSDLQNLLEGLWLGTRRVVGGPYFPKTKHFMLRKDGQAAFNAIGREGAPEKRLERNDFPFKKQNARFVSIYQAYAADELKITLVDCEVRTLSISRGTTVLQRCAIEKLEVRGPVTLYVRDSYIRNIDMRHPAATFKLVAARNCIFDIVDAPASSRPRISGNVLFENVRFARAFEARRHMKELEVKALPHCLRQFAKELRAAKNEHAAYHVQAAELSVEASFGPSVWSALPTRLYEYICDFGQDLKRPICLLGVVFMLAFAFAYYGGTVPVPRDLAGWMYDVTRSRVLSAAYVAALAAISPIAALSKTPFVAPATIWQWVVLKALGVCAFACWAGMFVAVRRRLRLAP